MDSKHQNELLPLANRRNKDMNHVTNNGNQYGHVKNAKPSIGLATMSCGEEEGCYTHPKVSQMAQHVKIRKKQAITIE